MAKKPKITPHIAKQLLAIMPLLNTCPHNIKWLTDTDEPTCNVDRAPRLLLRLGSYACTACWIKALDRNQASLSTYRYTLLKTALYFFEGCPHNRKWEHTPGCKDSLPYTAVICGYMPVCYDCWYQTLTEYLDLRK
jgi:hypothetical protein